MAGLLDKLKKNSKIAETSTLEKSAFYGDKSFVPTNVPAINIALSGSIRGGLMSGLTVVAGPSKHFKTSICLVMAAAFLKADPEAVVLFYDSEFGSPSSYFEAYDVDPARVLHTPITDIEQLKFDIMAQLNGLTKNDKVLILIDSVGNLASKKEVEDALNEKSAADMTRAKQLKSLFRMVTPHLTMKNVPMLAIATRIRRRKCIRRQSSVVVLELRTLQTTLGSFRAAKRKTAPIWLAIRLRSTSRNPA